jgi:hypothetical protein
MSELLSRTELDEILTQLRDKRSKQIELQNSHEQSGNYGMAYLALWAIGEDFAKRLGPICQKIELKTALTNWLAYVNGDSLKQPSKISAGKFDLAKSMTERIPREYSSTCA